jgi:CDP-glucose 4,6-dehydratase
MTLELLQKTYRGKRVLVTGHTGFKGSWLTAWLAKLGAEVIGISLNPDQGDDNIFDRTNVANLCAEDHRVDICDQPSVAEIFQDARPEIVFHLAAQALVRPAYAQPVDTFRTNILGTAHILEAARQTKSVAATVCVTTDKVYENNEWEWPYRENDRLGGIDPYSASKSGAEMVAKAYLEALPTPDDRIHHIAIARGGNVVGGGDWSTDRLVPDIIRSIRSNEPLELRNPGAIRPWQHVLELCYGYLLLASRLSFGWAEKNRDAVNFTGAWNFGPGWQNEITVAELVGIVLDTWGKADLPVHHQESALHESQYLKLDCTKARTLMGWQSMLGPKETFSWTTAWYRDYLNVPEKAQDILQAQISEFEQLLEKQDTQ